MEWGWPQILLIILVTITGTVKLIWHGEYKEVNFYAWVADATLFIIILYYGGFF